MILKSCKLVLTLFLCVQFRTSVEASTNEQDDENQKEVICHYESRPADADPNITDRLDESECNHVIHYERIKFDELPLGAVDIEIFDTRKSDAVEKFYDHIPVLRQKGIKVSIGMETRCHFYQQRLTQDPEKRALFFSSIVEYLERNNFSGFAVKQTDERCRTSDEHFMKFMRELSEALQPRGLSVSLLARSEHLVDPDFDVKELSKYVDWINILQIDGSSDKTALIAPLYFYPEDERPESTLNWTVNYLIEKGVPSQKIVLTVLPIGRSFELTSSGNGLNAPADFLPRRKFFFLLSCLRIKNQNFTVVHDKKVGTYAYLGNQWTSYTDFGDAYRLGEYIVQNNLGGGSIWPFNYEDTINKCGCGKQPLLSGLVQGLKGVTDVKSTNCT